VADPTIVCRTFATLAQKAGVKYVKNCQFKNLVTENGRVAAVDTSLGTVQCEFFVNCAGMVSWIQCKTIFDGNCVWSMESFLIIDMN
jgi:glycine/D-amino acid oxidase-like deaminating enzyme